MVFPIFLTCDEVCDITDFTRNKGVEIYKSANFSREFVVSFTDFFIGGLYVYLPSLVQITSKISLTTVLVGGNEIYALENFFSGLIPNQTMFYY